MKEVVGVEEEEVSAGRRPDARVAGGRQTAVLLSDVDDPVAESARDGVVPSSDPSLTTITSTAG